MAQRKTVAVRAGLLEDAKDAIEKLTLEKEAAEKETRLANDLLKDEEWAHSKTTEKLRAQEAARTETLGWYTEAYERNQKLLTYNAIMAVIAVVAIIALVIKVSVLS